MTEFTRDRLHREVRRTRAREQLRQYDSLGRRTLQRSELSTDVTLPEQAILERLYRYTARGELSGVSDTLRGEVDYGYDAEGRLLKHYEARQGTAARSSAMTPRITSPPMTMRYRSRITACSTGRRCL